MGKSRQPRDGRPPGPSNADAGIYHGRSVARTYASPDGLVILVGRTARDNDVLTLKLAAPRDFWLHIASGPGSHVVVRNPDGLDRLPRDSRQTAAALAVRFSRQRAGGRTAVHLCQVRDVTKPRGFADGKVALSRYQTVHASAAQLEGGHGD